MNEDEIRARVNILEKRRMEYLEVGNTKKANKIEEEENDNIYFTIYGRFLRVQGKLFTIPLGRAIKINYCPMCGRRLGE